MYCLQSGRVVTSCRWTSDTRLVCTRVMPGCDSTATNGRVLKSKAVTSRRHICSHLSTPAWRPRSAHAADLRGAMQHQLLMTRRSTTACSAAVSCCDAGAPSTLSFPQAPSPTLSPAPILLSGQTSKHFSRRRSSCRCAGKPRAARPEARGGRRHAAASGRQEGGMGKGQRGGAAGGAQGNQGAHA